MPTKLTLLSALLSVGLSLGCAGGKDGGQQRPGPRQATVGQREAPPSPDQVEDAPTPQLNAVTRFQAGRLFEARADQARRQQDAINARQNYVSAAAEYSRAIEQNPDFIYAYIRLSTVYMRLDRFDACDGVLKAALERQPQLATLHNNLGWSYLLQRRYRDAEASFQNALSLAPNFARARVNLGFAIGAQGRSDEALQAFEAVPGMTRAEAYYNLGHVHRQLGQADRAMASFQTALAYDPQLADAKAELERLRSEARARDAAAAAVRDLIAEDPRGLRVSDAARPGASDRELVVRELAVGESDEPRDSPIVSITDAAPKPRQPARVPRSAPPIAAMREPTASDAATSEADAPRRASPDAGSAHRPASSAQAAVVADREVAAESPAPSSPAEVEAVERPTGALAESPEAAPAEPVSATHEEASTDELDTPESEGVAAGEREPTPSDMNPGLADVPAAPVDSDSPGLGAVVEGPAGPDVEAVAADEPGLAELDQPAEGTPRDADIPAAASAEPMAAAPLQPAGPRVKVVQVRAAPVDASAGHFAAQPPAR